jgi:uncharacterized membrane protein
MRCMTELYEELRVAMAVGAATDAALWASVIGGLLVFLIAVPLHQGYQLRARARKPWPFPVSEVVGAHG